MNGITEVVLVFLAFGVLAAAAGFALGYFLGYGWDRTRAEKIHDGWVQAGVIVFATWAGGSIAMGLGYLATGGA